jgi:hypothetical protein
MSIGKAFVEGVGRFRTKGLVPGEERKTADLGCCHDLRTQIFRKAGFDARGRLDPGVEQRRSSQFVQGVAAEARVAGEADRPASRVAQGYRLATS